MLPLRPLLPTPAAMSISSSSEDYPGKGVISTCSFNNYKVGYPTDNPELTFVVSGTHSIVLPEEGEDDYDLGIPALSITMSDKDKARFGSYDAVSYSAAVVGLTNTISAQLRNHHSLDIPDINFGTVKAKLP
jgi:hypothetical protein